MIQVLIMVLFQKKQYGATEKQKNKEQPPKTQMINWYWIYMDGKRSVLELWASELRNATWRQSGSGGVTWQGENMNCSARDCRHCTIYNGIVGAMEREVREPLRQTHLAI